MRVLYFAWLRETLGKDGEDIVLHAGETAAQLARRLAAQGGGYASVFGDLARIRCAIDQSFAPLDTSLEGATEVAYFPPVTGG